jgi:hypothetical protein
MELVPILNSTVSVFELPAVVSCHSSWKNMYSLESVIAAWLVHDVVNAAPVFTSAVVLSVTVVPVREPEVSSVALVPSALALLHTLMLRWPMAPATPALMLRLKVQVPEAKVPV